MAGEPSPAEVLLMQVQEQGQALTLLSTHGQAQADALNQLHAQGQTQAVSLTQQAAALNQLQAQGLAQAASLAQQAQAMAQLEAALQTLLARLPAPPPPPAAPVLPVPALPDPAIPRPVLPVSLALPAGLTPRPKMYSGDPERCEEFLTQCTLQFQARPGPFTSDASKINYILLGLEGPALKWATPYVNRQDPLLLNYPLFLQEFTTVFERQFHRLTRRQEFVNFQQGSRNVITYVADFTALAAETTWEEEAKVTLFHRGLREDIKDAILTVHPEPDTMKELIRLALRIEHRLGDRKNRRKAEFRGYPVPGKPGPVSTDPVEPMVVGAGKGPLTAQERDRRRKLSLCFYCGQAGHGIAQCPNKPAQGNAPTV